MDRWIGLDQAQRSNAAVAIGVFDGVHRGHRALIRTAMSGAAAAGTPSVVLTFDPNPAEIVRSDPPARLSTMTQRLELLEGLGVDATVVLPFDQETSQLSPRAFFDRVIVDALGASAVYVGENFRFGYRASGDVAMLAEFGEEAGVAVSEVALVHESLVGTDDLPVSSTEVRRLVADGQMAAATRALVRPHRVEGEVVRGDQRGRDLGYPTANVEPTTLAAVPGDGVYAARVVLDPYTANRVHLPAAVSIGTNPTFGGSERQVEAYILDSGGDLDLYGRKLAVDFVGRVRDQRTFASADTLVAQMGADVERVAELLGLA